MDNADDVCPNSNEIRPSTVQVQNHPVADVDDSTVLSAMESQSLAVAPAVRRGAASAGAAATDNAPNKYSAIRIDEVVWEMRLQDLGCSKDELEKPTYRQNKIPPFGPKENQKYYPHLSAIAVDFLKSIISERNEDRGWARIPKNNTDAKLRIIELLLRMRKLGDDDSYFLDQTSLLSILETKWHLEQNSMHIESNDKLRLFGLLFLEKNTAKLHRLAEGISTRQQLDNPAEGLNYIYQELALDFNNDGICIELPAKAMDLDNFERNELDANDPTRTRINRDGEM